MGRARRLRNSSRSSGQSRSPAERGSAVQSTDIHSGNANMDVSTARDPIWTTAAAELQCPIAVKVAGLFGVFPRWPGSRDEESNCPAMVSYRGTRYFERSPASTELRWQRVLPHPDRDGQKHVPASGLCGPCRMPQRRDSRGQSDGSCPAGNDVSAVNAAGGYRRGGASAASESLRRPDSQLVL